MVKITTKKLSIMKTTKKEINEKIRSTKVDSANLGRIYNHFYQHDTHESFELHHARPIIMHHKGNNSYERVEATTKREFIDFIYDYLNK